MFVPGPLEAPVGRATSTEDHETAKGVAQDLALIEQAGCTPVLSYQEAHEFSSMNLLLVSH